MELRNLKTFLYVAEQCSFSKAAILLNYSQSTVTAQIQKLEEELDILLFERINKTVRLTNAGQAFLKYAHEIIRTSEDAKKALKNLPIETGELRIAMAESIANTFFPEILERFHQLYPKIKVTLYTAGTDSLFHKLRHNEADLLYTLDKRIYSSEIVTVMEKKEEVFFVASPKHRLAGKNCLIEDLLGEDFLLTEKDMSYRRHLEEYLASKSLEINPFLELGNVEILKSLVEKNAGISFLPEFTIKRQLEEQRLVKINIPEVFKVWRQLIYHKHKWVTASMKVMIDLIRDYGYDKKNFTYKTFKGADYDQLKCSAKFNPAFFRKSGDTWEGGSVSMFSPVLKFSLHEKFTENQLEVSESMEVNGKRTFGYDEPIIYKRIK